MPKIVVNERDAEARVPKGLLVVRAFASPVGTTAHPRAIARSGVQVPPPLVPPPPGSLVVGVDDIDGVTLRIVADGTFPAGSAVTVGVEVAAYSVEIGPLSVGGLSSQDVAVLAVVDDQVVVRVVAGEGELIELSAVGDAAQAATADLLGAARVSPDRRVDVDIVLDGSASFRALPAEAIAHAVDVLAGVAAVVADPRVAVTISGLSPHTELVDGLGSLSARASALLSGAPRSSGARLPAAVSAGRPASVKLRKWVVTDEVPSDVDRLRAAAGGPGALAVVVLADGPSTPVADAGGVPIAFIDVSALASSTGAPGAVPFAQIVASLVRPSAGERIDGGVSS